MKSSFRGAGVGGTTVGVTTGVSVGGISVGLETGVGDATGAPLKGDVRNHPAKITSQRE